MKRKIIKTAKSEVQKEIIGKSVGKTFHRSEWRRIKNIISCFLFAHKSNNHHHFLNRQYFFCCCCISVITVTPKLCHWTWAGSHVWIYFSLWFLCEISRSRSAECEREGDKNDHNHNFHDTKQVSDREKKKVISHPLFHLLTFSLTALYFSATEERYKHLTLIAAITITLMGLIEH